MTPKSESINGANFIDKAYDVASVTFTLDTDFGVIKSITAKQEFYDQFNLDRDGTEVQIFDTLTFPKPRPSPRTEFKRRKRGMSLVFGGFIWMTKPLDIHILIIHFLFWFSFSKWY